MVTIKEISQTIGDNFHNLRARNEDYTVEEVFLSNNEKNITIQARNPSTASTITLTLIPPPKNAERNDWWGRYELKGREGAKKEEGGLRFSVIPIEEQKEITMYVRKKITPPEPPSAIAVTWTLKA